MDKKALKAKILNLISKAESEMIDLEDMTQPVAPENSIGRISRMDAINNKSVMEAALRNKKRKLSKLRVALQNVDQESFGICNNCNNEIKEARIIYMPESTLCVHCAQKQ